jgi:hypothetical protein
MPVSCQSGPSATKNSPIGRPPKASTAGGRLARGHGRGGFPGRFSVRFGCNHWNRAISGLDKPIVRLPSARLRVPVSARTCLRPGQ